MSATTTEPAKLEPPADPFIRGRDRIRETVKWLITSFGAIAASLALGSQISSLGKVDGWRLAVAVGAALLGFAGAFAAIAFAVKVITTGTVTLGELARTADKDLSKLVEDEPQLLGAHTSVEGLRQDFLDAIRAGDQTATDALGTIIGRLLGVASFEKLRLAFDRKLPWIIGSVAVAAVGVIGFAWAANPPKEEQAGSTATPTEIPVAAELSLSPGGRARLQDELGPGCTDPTLPVVALQATTRGIDVVTLPTARCNVTRFTLIGILGTLTPSKPACRIDTTAGKPPTLNCSAP